MALRGVITLAGVGCFYFKNASADSSPTTKRVVIIGGGVMGASTAWNLTGRKDNQKVEVTLIDANHPIRGSWHESRIIRAAYEDKMYVAMVMRAFDHWNRLEKEAGKGQLVHMSGILDIGAKHRLTALIQNYKELGLPVELFSGTTSESRAHFDAKFPTIRLGHLQDAVYQKDTAIVKADVSVQAMLELSQDRGAVLHLDDAVAKIDRKARTVTTQKGVVCGYDKLVVASGPWTNATLALADLSMLPLVISNEQAVYLQPREGVSDSQLEPSKSPVVVEHDTNIYAVPHLPGGVPGCKIGAHAAGDFMHNEEFVLPAGARGMLRQLEQPSKQVHAIQSDAIHRPMLKVFFYFLALSLSFSLSLTLTHSHSLTHTHSTHSLSSVTLSLLFYISSRVSYARTALHYLGSARLRSSHLPSAQPRIRRRYLYPLLVPEPYAKRPSHGANERVLERLRRGHTPRGPARLGHGRIHR